MSTRLNSSWTLNLGYNSLEEIQNNAFDNLQAFANGNNISLQLNNNELESFEDDAFAGIDNLVTIIDVSDNMFTSIPAAVAKLTRLNSLLIRNNPVMKTDPLVFIAIRCTLTHLEISLNNTGRVKRI